MSSCFDFDWREDMRGERQSVETGVDLSSGSKESCSQGTGCRAWCHSFGGRGEIGIYVGGWRGWGVVTEVYVCVCDWSAGWFALEGRNEGGADKACLPQEHIHTHTDTHPLTPTHSQGSETLQIETSPLCPPSLLFGPWKFWITRRVAPHLWCEWESRLSDSHSPQVTFQRRTKKAETLGDWVGSGSD